MQSTNISIAWSISPTLPVIVTPTDKIPNFGAYPTKVAEQSGDWSKPSTWIGGVVPGDGDVVQIPAGIDVGYDIVSTARLNCISVLGSLFWVVDQPTELHVTHLQVLQGGTVIIGTDATPVTSTAKIIINDVPLDPRDPEQYGNGIICFGRFMACGAVDGQFTSWMRLAAEPLKSATTLTLSQPALGWNIGDKIIIPDTRQLKRAERYTAFVPQWEEVTVAAISADRLTITLAAPLVFDHVGARDPDGVLKYLPHVGNLTRRVQIRSENAAGTRGHVMFTMTADVDVCHVEFAGLGRTTQAPLDSTTFNADGTVKHYGTNQIGRYPVHFHHVMGMVGNQYSFQFTNCSSHCPMPNNQRKWGINLHATSRGLLTDNVVFNWAGGGITGEVGQENLNIIDRNFVVGIVGSTNPRVNDGSDGSAFWFHGVNNYFRGNVAASSNNTYVGIVSSSGFNLFCPPGSHANTPVPNFVGADPAIPSQNTLVNLQLQPVLDFTGNEAYGCMSTPLTLWNVGNGQPYATIPSTVKNFVGWHFFEQLFFGYPIYNITFDGLTAFGHPRCLNATDWASFFSTGDYQSNNTTIVNANVQNLYYGVMQCTDIMGTFSIKDSFFRNIYNIDLYSAATPGSRSLVLPHATRIDNVRYQQLNASTPLSTIRMVYKIWSGGNNYTVLDQIFVTNHNGVVGDNFQLFYTQQAPSFIVPQTTYYGPNNSLIDSQGAPVAGLTNAQAMAQYGIAIAGAVYPPNAVTRPDILGMVV